MTLGGEPALELSSSVHSGDGSAVFSLIGFP
jgi:hypothetical protein